MRLRQAGFTLIEIAVTLAVLGVILVTVYGVFSRTLEAKETVEARTERTGLARTTMMRLSSDLRGLVVHLPRTPGALRPRERDGEPREEGVARQLDPFFVSKDGSEAGVPVDDLAFTTLIRRPVSLAQSALDVTAVRYVVLRGSDRTDGTFTLYRESVSSLSEDPFDLEEIDPERTVDLLDGVAALRFRFFDGEEWVEEWDSIRDSRKGPAPLAIEVMLALAGDGAGEKPEVFRTSFDLPHAGASSGTTTGTASPAEDSLASDTGGGGISELTGE